MNTKKVLAIWIALLVLSIPFAYSLTIREVVATSSTGFQDIIKRGNETVSFDIFLTNLVVNNEVVTPEILENHSGVTIVGTQEHTVTDCSYVAGDNSTIVCSRTLNMNVPPGLNVFTYHVKVGDVARIDNLHLYPDMTPPHDLSLSVQQKGPEMEYTLSAKDRVDSLSSPVCSGLGSYQIYFQGDEQTSTQREGSFEGGCSETVTGNFSLSGASDGLLSVCARVFDRMGNNASTCTSAEIDVTPPEIGSIGLVLPSGQPLEYISSNGADVRVQFTATENGNLDISNSILQVRRVSGNALIDEVIGFSCSFTQLLDSRQYTCTSSTFPVTSGSVEVNLELKDMSGNVATGSTTVELQVDNVPPTVQQIRGPTQSGNTFYSRGGDNFTVVFQEDGIGMHNGDAYLRFGLDGSGVVRATSCTGSGSTWECFFPIPSLSEGSYVVAVDGQTADDAGNRVSSDTTVTLVIDRTPPQISDISYEGINQLGRFDFASAGGRVSLEFRATDRSPFTTEVDFSALGGAAGVQQVDCIDNQCSVISSAIGDGGSVETVVITATDIVGNVATETFDLRVLTVAGESNHWRGEVRLSPRGWDREVAELISQKGIAEITLTSPTQTDIISAEFQECVNIENLSQLQGGNQYLADITYIASSDDQDVHYINLESQEAFLPLNEIIIECRFEVQSFGPTELVPSEIVRVPVIIPLYNNPFDMPDQALQDKIDRAVRDTQGYLKTIDRIYKWVMWLEKLCGIFNTVYSIIVALGVILSALGVIEQGMDSTFFGKLFSGGVNQAQSSLCDGQTGVKEGADNAYVEFISKFCRWVACDISLWDMSEDGTLLGMENPMGFMDNFGSNAYGETFGNLTRANQVQPFGSDSIITQIQNMCVPGMLRKFSDYRGIRCEYALCLIEQVESGFVDESACETVKNTLECEFWYGEIWSLIPFSGLLDSLFELWAMLERPHFSDLIQLTSWTCHALCNVPKYPGMIEQACAMQYEITNLANSITTILNAKDNFDRYLNFDKARQSCDRMEDALREMRDRNQAFEDKVRQRTVPSGLTNTDGLRNMGLPEGYGGADGTTQQGGSQTVNQNVGSPALPDGFGGDDGTSN